jgi:uncharacterized membrane protein YgcG
MDRPPRLVSAASVLLGVLLAACTSDAPPSPSTQPAPTETVAATAQATASPLAISSAPATPADVPAAGPPYPEPLTNEVVYDYAHIFSPETEASVSTTIAAIEQRVGAEIVVYSQLKPGSTTASTETDARALIDQWGLGLAGVDDGLAILFNMQRDTCDPGAGGNGQVQLFAAPGFSAPYLSDAQRQQIFDADMLPLLRECQLDAALLIALDRLDSATAEPVDVAQEFVRQLVAAQGIEADISGEASFAGSVFSFGGEFRGNALGDQQTRLVATLPDGTQAVSEEILVSGSRYSSSNDGPWLPEQGDPANAPSTPRPSGDPSAGLISALDNIASVTDRGVVTRDGRTLHRLVAPPDVVLDPAAIGLDDPSFSGASAALEFFAEPDGTPAIMILSADWQSMIGGHELPGSMTLEFTFRDFGGVVDIATPADAWEWQALDELGLTYAQPPGWFVEPDTGGFSIISPTGDSIWLFRARGWRGAELRRTSADDVRLVREAWAEDGYNLALESTYELDVGGQPALVADLTDAARRLSVQSGVLIKGDRLYVLQYVVWGDNRHAARPFFENFLGTVAFDR